MTERLEEIKNVRWENLRTSQIIHIKWLIEQAERVQELEGENRILRTVAESNKYIGEQYLEQNKRYREALRKIIKEGENGEYSHYTAQRALEEKTDE